MNISPTHLCLAVAGALALSCASAFAETDDATILAPNSHLTAEGIPPISRALAEKVGQYTDFRPRFLLDWHPKKREMLLSTRSKGVANQLHLLRKPMGELEQLTDFPDPVRQAQFEPKAGKYLVFEKDDGGSEANQLYRLDLDGGNDGNGHKVTLLTDPAEKHHAGPWNHAKNRLLMFSTQLDKTAGTERRKEVTTELAILDPLHPESKRKVMSLPGGGWVEFQWSPNDRQLLAVNRLSANEAKVWLFDLAKGGKRQILPVAGDVSEVPVYYHNVHFTKDGKSILASTDHDGEFRQLRKIDLATLKSTPLSKHIPWDIDQIEPSAYNRQIAVLANNDGLDQMHLFDGVNGRELPVTALPVGAVSKIKWRNAGELGFDLSSAKSPGELYSLDVKSGKVLQWSSPQAGVDTAKFRDPAIIRWESFDQRRISAMISRPPEGKFSGPRPVLVQIHGGPESQAKVGFLGRHNYLVNELGIVVIQPNVRGSSGYGKTFLRLDNGFQREDSVKDIGALFDWIAAQPDLDAKRVAVAGGSYGGYMSLAVSTHYPERIVGAIDMVGISHFATFLERTESYRRDLRRVEYGDERIPAMREFMDAIAPLNNAAKITKPLFVVQGKNDPRVPLNEAEQIVARVRKNNVPVWYLMADNEGHGFARKPNSDFYFFSQVKFFEEYLLK